MNRGTLLPTGEMSFAWLGSRLYLINRKDQKNGITGEVEARTPYGVAGPNKRCEVVAKCKVTRCGSGYNPKTEPGLRSSYGPSSNASAGRQVRK